MITFHNLIGLCALIVLEIVLGIDNLIFLTILTQRLPESSRVRAARFGLMMAWVGRLALLVSVIWMVQWTTPILHFQSYAFSVRDICLMMGGAFLILKATQEIHDEMNPCEEEGETPPMVSYSMGRVMLQIALMDLIFSLDSVVTAVGLTAEVWVMIVAMTVAMLVMWKASQPVATFIRRYPMFKMLALSFLILIGTVLMADAWGCDIPRGYVYFAMGFSLFVECLNVLRRRRCRDF